MASYYSYLWAEFYLFSIHIFLRSFKPFGFHIIPREW